MSELHTSVLHIVNVHADGGCSNNGTPDAKGYASVLIEGTKSTMHRIDLPHATTNNQAELGALWSALDLLKITLLHPDIQWRIYINMDSNFALNTVFGDWNIKNKYPVLQSLRDDCKAIIRQLKDADVHVESVKVERSAMEAMVGH